MILKSQQVCGLLNTGLQVVCLGVYYYIGIAVGWFFKAGVFTGELFHFTGRHFGIEALGVALLAGGE